MGRRYCGVQSCQNFFGTSDRNVGFFRLPVYEPEILAKWKQAVNRETPGNFLLCSLHFRQEDVLWNKTYVRLRPGAFPIPVPKTVKTEISDELPKNEPITDEAITEYFSTDELPTEEPHTEHVEIMDIEANESASDEQELCQSCINYEVQLQAAHTEIAVLKEKLNELTVENNMMKSQIRSISTKYSTCHIISTIQEPESVTLTIEPDQPISIDEKILNDCSVLPNSLFNDEMDGSSVSEPSEEIKRYNKSVETVTDVSLEPRQPTFKMFQCGRCDIAFELAAELARHMTACHDTKTIIVPRLPKEKTRAVRKKKEGKSYQCHLCRTSFSTFNGVRVHMKRHERDQKCEICKMELTANELSSHLCGDVKSILCDYCPIKFTVTSELVEHLKKSHEKRKQFYRCEKCSRYLPMFVLKEFHMKSHARELKPFVCKVCHKDFASKLLLKLHAKRHDETKSHLCEECGTSYASSRNLLLHKNSYIHTKETPFHCPHCPKKFSQRSNFKSHMEKHQEDKYPCEICQTELLSKRSFDKHMKRHRRTEADRKFDCKLCPRKFFSSQAVRKHQQVHIGVRSFSCKFCDAKYKYKGDLNKHLKTHMGNKIHECKKCFELFEYKDLLKHEDEHYKQEKEASEMNE
ncbi:zinc finger protein 700-like isoform X2 [Sitodiplosis mosellana]|uniref:zinc finger protein 700-like isoform X2 n=1 Tax=Sitodiplosis mosellana TaxID=263140 RepID=UPI00244419B6|nr:zinc finger protein 700-like isoform X2 [Sitodiplosis mosellana]